MDTSESNTVLHALHRETYTTQTHIANAWSWCTCLACCAVVERVCVIKLDAFISLASRKMLFYSYLYESLVL